MLLLARACDPIMPSPTQAKPFDKSALPPADVCLASFLLHHLRARAQVLGQQLGMLRNVNLTPMLIAPTRDRRPVPDPHTHMCTRNPPRAEGCISSPTFRSARLASSRARCFMLAPAARHDGIKSQSLCVAVSFKRRGRGVRLKEGAVPRPYQQSYNHGAHSSVC